MGIVPMSSKTIKLTEALHKYLLSVSLREADYLRKIREYTATLPDSNMQISPEQGQLMALLTKLIDARKVLEIGTYTGYSALSFATAMSKGVVVTIDRNSDTTNIATTFWKDAGVLDKIDSRVGNANDILRSLIQVESLAGTFDLVFIDADKENYISYYEYALELIRTNGLILIDNVLWGGSVIDSKNKEKDTLAIRRLNEHLKVDTRIDMSLVPIGDGLTIARKKCGE